MNWEKLRGKSKEMQIVYADSQFMLAAVHPSKVQFEIQRSRGSVTEADNRDCMTEKISNNSMYNKDDDNHLQKQTEDNIIQDNEEKAQPYSSHSGTAVKGPRSLEHLLKQENILENVCCTPTYHQSTCDSCAKTMITAENASTMLNIIVSKKLVKNELPVRKVEHVVTSDKSNSKIFKTVLKRRSESMPEISRSRSSGSTLAIEDCTTYYKNGQEISEIINYTRKKMSLSLVDLHCESNDTGNCSSHTSLRCNLKATGKHYKKKCTMEGRRFESINVTKNNVTDDDDSKYAARLTVKKGLYKKQQHTFSEDTDLMLLASPGVEGSSILNKQLYIEGKIKHSRRSANTKSSREKCIKTIKSRSKRRIVADERCIQKHDSVSQEICDHLLNSYSDSKCLGLETHSENELCILESESGSDTNISQNRMTIRDNYSHRVLKKTVKIASDMALKSSALMHTCVDDGHHSSVKVRSDQPKFDVQTVDEIEGVLLNLEKGIESSIKKLHSKPILNDVPKVCNFVKICVSSSVDSNSKTKEVRCLTKEYDNVHSDADVSTNLILNQVNSKCTFQAAAQHEVIVNMSNTASIGKGILIQNVSPIKPNILRTPGKNDDACYKCVEDIADSFGRYGSSVCQEYALNEFSGKRQITSNQKQTESVEHFCVIESNCENDVHFKMENSTSKIRDIHVTRKCVSDVSVHLCQLCNKVKCLKSYWSLLNHKQDDYSQLANNIVRGPLSCKVEVINLQSKMVSELSYSETNANIENLISSKIKIPVAINISDTRHSTLENISSLSSSAGSFLPPQKKLLTATWNLAADRPKWDATVDLYLHCDDVIFPVHRLVLVHFSRRLCRLLYIGSLPPKQVIVVRRVSSGALKEVLSWMYTGKINLTSHNIMEILLAALSLEIPELQKICVCKIACFGDPIHYMQLVHVARCRNEKNLASDAMNLLASVFSTVVQGEGFLNFNFDDVCLLLSWDTLNAQSEYDVYRAAIRWLSYNWPHRQFHVSRIMNCVRFAHMTLAALDELLTPKVGTGVEHLILTNESVKASLQTALLFKAYQAECDAYTFRYTLLPPRRFICNEAVNLNLSACEVKKDRSLLVMNPLFMNIRQAFDYTSTTESASHQAVASSFFENNENVLSDTGLVGTVVSRKFEKVQKAEFQKLVTEGDAMVSSKTKSAHVETKTSIEETLKSSAHDSVYNADLLKSNTATIDIPLSDSNVTLNEAVDIQGMKIVKDSHSYSLQSTKKENVSENDSNKNSLWSGREDENREYSCIVNNDNVNSFDWRSLTHIHSGMSLTSAEIAATNMEHMKVQGQVIKKTMAGTSKSNSVIVMKPFKTMANFEDADQKSLGSGLLSKSTSKYSQMDEQSLLSKVTYSVKSEGNNTYLSMDDLPCPESEIELSSGSGPEYSRLSEDEPSFVVSVEHSNDDSQEISLHPSNMLECHSNSSFKEYKDEIKRVGRYGSADAYRKIIVTNVKRSVTQKPKVVIFLKRSKIFPQTQVSVKQPISTGVYTKSSYKNRQLSAKVDKGEYDLDIKELGIQKSSYSSTSFSVDDYMCVKNEIGHLSSVLERCNASAENSQTISLHDSDSSNDDTPKESHHSEYALMSNSGGHLSSQLGSSDSGDIRGDNMNNSSSFFSSKNGTLLRSEIDGIHCHHSSNKEECAYQEVPNEDVLSITKSKAIFTERKSKGRFRSLRSSCSPHYSEKRSNWQYSRLEDLHFNSRPEDETFVITSRHKKTGQKLTDPFEIFETLMPESPKKLAYHCVLLFGGRSKPNIHEFDKTCYFVHCYSVERQTWHELGKMPAPRFDVSACLYGNGIYVAGGVDPRIVSFEGCGKSSSSFWYLNLSDWSWHNLRNMPHARAGHSLVGLAKRLYAIGGAEHSFGNGLTSAVDVYDPENDQWTSVAPLPVPLWKMAAATHCGLIWVCGGSMKSPTDFKGMVRDVTSDVYIYKRRHNVWIKSEHRLLHECAMASLVEVKEDLVLVGGLTHSTLHNRQELIDEVTVCLPQSGSWIKLTNMQDGVFSASVVASGNDIIIIGGRNARFYPPLNKVDVFDFKNCIWKKGQNRIPIPISNSAAVALPIVKCKVLKVSSSSVDF